MLKQSVSKHASSMFSAPNCLNFSRNIVFSFYIVSFYLTCLSYNTDDQSSRESISHYGEVVEGMLALSVPSKFVIRQKYVRIMIWILQLLTCNIYYVDKMVFLNLNMGLEHYLDLRVFYIYTNILKRAMTEGSNL